MKFLKNKLGIKRFPPIMFPFIIPIYVLFGLFYTILFLIMWLFGFWRCRNCKKIKNIKDSKYYKQEIFIDGYTLTNPICPDCRAIELLRNNHIERVER
jgi:hypothetical protein